MTKRLRMALPFILIWALVLVIPAAPVSAQEGVTVLAEGFNAPQGVLVAPDGSVWVIDSGVGGDTEFTTIDPSGQEVSATYGETARIVKIDPDGTQTDVAFLPSVFSNDEAVGGGRLALVDDTLYATSGVWVGDGTENVPPEDPNMAAVVRVNEDGTLEPVANTWRIERRMNPDNTVYESHPYGLAADPNGNLWVADSGANTILRINPDSAIVELVTTFPALPGVFPNPLRGGEMLTDPVPTGIAFDDEGNAFVSLLSGAPFVPGSAKVVKVTPAGARTDYATNLTMLTDIRRGPDGEFYAVQFAVFTETGPTPNSGALVKVSEGMTSTVVVDGLSFPTSVDFDEDGNAYITINGVGAPGSGAVVKYDGVANGETYVTGAGAAEEATPAATEEATEEATAEPTAEPTEEATEEATAEPTEEATEEATAEPTEEATEEATAEPTEEPTAQATAGAGQAGTPEPTAQAAQVATPEPTEEATPEATEEATAEATEEATEEATPEPTEEATEEATAESSVTASDQESDGTQVTIDQVDAAEAGWIVIYADEDGAPGEVLGQTAVAPGTTDNVIVNLDTPISGETTLWAVLHVDAGTQGTFEFPGADVAAGGDDEGVRASFVVTAAEAEAAGAESAELQDLVDTAASTPTFSTLVAAVQAAGLVDVLKGEGPFTLFAPTNDAFAALPAGTIDALLADPQGDLTDILLYHVVAGRVMAADITDGLMVESVLGETLTFAVDGDTITVNGANLVTTDIQASNGVIHVIDTVLIPGAAEAVATPEATEEPAEEATPAATEEPTAEATVEATAEPTEEATPEATVEAMEEATPEPTEEAAAEATPEATAEATEEATPAATEEAVEEATPAVTEEAAEEGAPSGAKGGDDAPATLPNTGSPLPGPLSIAAIVTALASALGAYSLRRRR